MGASRSWNHPQADIPSVVGGDPSFPTLRRKSRRDVRSLLSGRRRRDEQATTPDSELHKLMQASFIGINDIGQRGGNSNRRTKKMVTSPFPLSSLPVSLRCLYYLLWPFLKVGEYGLRSQKVKQNAFTVAGKYGQTARRPTDCRSHI